MKKLNYKRISLLLLLTIICIPLCACKKPETEEPSEQPNEQIQAPTRTPSTDKNEKNEMVYIILDKTGKKQKVIVNDRIINKQCLDEIKDLTNLDNLKLIKGNATFTKDLNNVTWNANKEDIYYTGETDKEIPVNISIKYYLNENEVTYEQLQGKSGKVTIRFDYTCNQSEIVKINNEDKTIYVPYLIISGVAFNNAKTANITSQNGKVIDDGKNSFVVGCAIPGLKEDLEIEDLNIPTYFEISMDAVDFNMDTTFSVATNQFMNGINSNDIKDEKQKTKVNTLCLMLAKEELLPTVNEVVKSLDEYNDYYKGVIDYTSGVDQMDQEIKAGNLEDKLQELLDGSKKLNDGTIKLNTELQEFYENTLKDILEKYNNDFTNMVERICIINDVIAKYQMFTSVSSDMIGKTTYIYTTK
jgi:membrane protein-like protein